ncbi:CPBP family intramembrane glutamic endopeptidase [Nitrincola alkalilacustris]|uniref:CPBP family intramembrane glutamic endopeptidase n=1 Tax=Nitrincola alkalilacustris TaxID=1571224 RepID=UPI00124DD141|nr:CPBP family intramembrane glutamic endopeptidase [Nitrincola alkalilacustris]
MLYFGLLYSTALILLGLSKHAQLRYGGAAFILLTAAVIGYSSWMFFAGAIAYIALTAWMLEQTVPTVLRWIRYALWFLASTALVVHAMPGYEGLLVAEQVVLKPGSAATNLYFNHDKVLVAWSLLNFIPMFRQSTSPRPLKPLWLMPLIITLGIAAALTLAVNLGLINWQPVWTPLFWIFAAGNLLNTCITEELLFRGLLQRQLQQRLTPLLALAAAALLFGLAHLAGGWAYVGVATLTGVLYGLVYYWSGRVVWAVLVHWFLNLSHIMLFTYPLSAT